MFELSNLHVPLVGLITHPPELFPTDLLKELHAFDNFDDYGKRRCVIILLYECPGVIQNLLELLHKLEVSLHRFCTSDVLVAIHHNIVQIYV